MNFATKHPILFFILLLIVISVVAQLISMAIAVKGVNEYCKNNPGAEGCN